MSPFAFVPLFAPAALVLAAAVSSGRSPRVDVAVRGAGPSFVPAAAPTTIAFARPSSIARLVTHDRVLSIRASSDGPRFDVDDRAGRALAIGLADADLRAQFPALHELVDPLRGARADAFLDASIDENALRGRDEAR